MQRLTVVLFLLSAAATEPDVLGVYPADEVTDAQHPEDVQVSVDQSTTSDGKGSLKVTYAGGGAAEAMLFKEELAGVDDAILWYEADIRCDAPGGMAYAALWMMFPDGSSYFSRGLDQRCGPDWRRSRIPFRLEKGQRPERVMMGVRFEGPGTVWVDNARLAMTALESACSRRTDVLGAITGAAAGLWGGLAGISVSRGKRKRLVLGLGAALLFIEVAVLGVGLGTLAMGYAPAVWSPLVVAGAIGTIAFLVLLPLVNKRYRDLEVQRLAAQDASDSL